MKRTPLKRKHYVIKSAKLKRGASVIKRSPLKRKPTKVRSGGFRIVLSKSDYQALDQEVKVRDGFRCRHCGGEYMISSHHIIYRSHGGDDSYQNLICLDARCHSAVHASKLKIIGNALNAEFVVLGDF